MSAGSFSDSAVARAIRADRVTSGIVPIALAESAQSVPTFLIAPSATRSLPRIDSLDAARLIAVAGVIFVHAVEAPALERLSLVGTFGVPFYLFASLYFQARSFNHNPDRPLQWYIWARAKRLYLPFLAWSIIYLFARDLKHLLLSDVPPVRVTAFTMFVVGTAHHLWFLPVLTIATIVTAIANRLCGQDRQARWWVLGISALVGAALATMPRPAWLSQASGGEEGYFFLQAWKALPSAFLGLALAWWLILDFGDALFPVALGCAGVLLTVATLSNQLFYGYSRLDRTLSGLGWVIAALARWRGPIVTVLAKIGRLGYGIYLSHVLFVEGLQAMAHRIGLRASLGFDLFTFGFALAGATVLTIMLDRNKYLNWLNG